MITVTFIDNIFSHKREIVEAEDILSALTKRFPVWPKNARLFYERIAHSHDVTPGDEAGIERLRGIQGNFICVTMPAEPATIIAIVIAVIAVAVAFLFRPSVPKPTNRNTRSTSPNNELSARGNQARQGGRIPDIFGEVRAVPDLIVSPYSEYIANTEVENCVMCIGRGSYEVHDMYDGDTACDQIHDTSVQVYAPFTNINTGTPFFTVGEPIPGDALMSFRSNSINGQKLEPSNRRTFNGSGNVIFSYPNIVTISGFDETAISDLFRTGGIIDISNSSVDGQYTVSGIAYNGLRLSNPAAVNPDWNALLNLPDQSTAPESPIIANTGIHWVGPYILEDPDRTDVWVNIVALNGLYKDDGRNSRAETVTSEFEITPVDRNNQPIGNTELFSFSMRGAPGSQSTVAITGKMQTTFKGRCSVRGRRTSNTDAGFQGSVVDEIQWRDLYGMAPLPRAEFGNVTVLRSRTVATTGALAVKERKLNCLVTRKINRRISGDNFSAELYPSKNAADILSFVALDPYIGNRDKAELDFDNIYDTLEEVREYFGTPLLTEFCYTLDNENLSFEETATMIAGVTFCTPYRLGSLIRLTFERETDMSLLLFNHRNKLPGTETRTMEFGYSGDNDGIVYEWISPLDDAMVTMRLPETGAVNPMTIESVGVRNNVQAHMQAYRAWQKLKHQNLSLEMETTYEAETLVPTDRILIADNIGGIVRDGEVTGMDGLEVFTSQRDLKLTPDTPYSCFLQLSDGTTQAVQVRAGSGKDSFILAEPPLIPLVYGYDRFARTTFLIVENTEDEKRSAFLVAEKESLGGLKTRVKAANYDARFYAHDKDFLKGIVIEREAV